jgi:hypothetical protein
MQTIRKIVLRLFIGGATVYAVLAFHSIYFPTHYEGCERKTKRLNGGEKIFAGQKFKIELCGNGGDEDFNNDEIRMQIFSERGELLAKRRFVVDWNGTGPFPLEYSSGYLTYFDLAKRGGFEHKMSLPPSRLDWIRARVPLAD